MYYLGIDLGGTNIAIGVVDEAGNIVSSLSVPTNAGRDYREIVKDMAETSKKVMEQAGISPEKIISAGIGSPGTIDSENGVCVYSNNLKIENAKVVEGLKKYFNFPIFMENDANATAYGEYVLEGNNAKSFVFITLGTGVGGGVVIDGKLFKGFNGAGAELGHIVTHSGGVACTCGRCGCWEAYASVTALVRQTEEAIKENPESLMAVLKKEEGKVSGKTAFVAAKQGDKTAKKVVNKYFEYIGEGLTDIVNIFQPEKVVIGGSISKEGDYLLEPVKEYVKKFDYNRYMPKVKVEISRHHGDMGIIGAAFIGKSRI